MASDRVFDDVVNAKGQPLRCPSKSMIAQRRGVVKAEGDSRLTLAASCALGSAAMDRERGTNREKLRAKREERKEKSEHKSGLDFTARYSGRNLAQRG